MTSGDFKFYGGLNSSRHGGVAVPEGLLPGPHSVTLCSFQASEEWLLFLAKKTGPPCFANREVPQSWKRAGRLELTF